MPESTCTMPLSQGSFSPVYTEPGDMALNVTLRSRQIRPYAGEEDRAFRRRMQRLRVLLYRIGTSEVQLRFECQGDRTICAVLQYHDLLEQQPGFLS